MSWPTSGAPPESRKPRRGPVGGPASHVSGHSSGDTVAPMRAVTIAEPGGPEVLTWAEVPDPVSGPDEVIIDVVASAVNRADLLQRQGFYPPPPGASEILGLECS